MDLSKHHQNVEKSTSSESEPSTFMTLWVPGAEPSAPTLRGLQRNVFAYSCLALAGVDHMLRLQTNSPASCHQLIWSQQNCHVSMGWLYVYSLHGRQTNTCRELRRCGFHDSGLSTFRNDNLLFSFGPYRQATHVLFVERKKRCHYRCHTSCGTLDTSSGFIACNACWYLEIWWFGHCFFHREADSMPKYKGKKHHTKVLEVDGAKINLQAANG